MTEQTTTLITTVIGAVIGPILLSLFNYYVQQLEKGSKKVGPGPAPPKPIYSLRVWQVLVVGIILGAIVGFIVSLALLNKSHLIDTMDDPSNWTPSFCDDKCGGSNRSSAILISLVPGKTNDALEILYDLRYTGWILLTKNLDSQIRPVLSRTKGIRVSYKGIGASNTIEIKLLLRYPGDVADTAFGASWKRATNTNDSWVSIEALYDRDFKCWWPTDLCEKHGNTLDLESVQRIDLAISNKLGDTAGLGRVTFDNLIGIPP